MARYINVHSKKKPIEMSDEARGEFEGFLTREIEDAISSRHSLESTWRTLMRMYEGIPKNPARNFPVENAPNIEITLGAIASDALYAAIVDLVFTTSPLVTVRGVPKMKEDKEYASGVKAFQRWINWVAANEAHIREAADDAILDNVQLGTGALYTPWTEEVRNTRVSKVINRGPRIWAIPIEDCLIPGGSKTHDIDQLPWIGIRFWLNEYELQERADKNNWDISGAQKAAAQDWVSVRRETIGRHITGVERAGSLYEVIDCYCYYDIDGDGIREDLYCVFDRTSRSLLAVYYNPYDRRPIKTMVYQRRAHMPYGLGVLQMLAPYQEELTELHNYGTLNALLANCRMWKGREGRIPENMKIWPGRVIELLDPDNDLKAEVMADVYPSIMQNQGMIMQLAERRVGANELSPQPKPQMFGSRMPGITAMSMMQQVNKRFTPAFDSARGALAASLMQCMYRYQEKVLAGDSKAIEHIYDVLGVEDGSRVVAMLSEQSFDENIIVEMTAATASINKEADRQNAMMLVQVLSGYYQRTLELVSIASDPQAPPEVKQVALKIAEAAGEVIDRTIRTFDQVRDPALFMIEIDEEMESAMANAPQQGIQQLMQMMAGGLGQGGQQPLLPGA